MRRTTVLLPDDVDASLRYEARRRRTSVAEVIREALQSFLPKPDARRELGFFAIGEGGRDDAERVDEIVSAAISRRHPQS